MLRREIGSEFCDIPSADADNGLFGDDIDWFLSGRSALAAVVAENDFHTVALPDYCCESMIQPFLNAGIKVVFYPAFAAEIGSDADAVLVMNYFGHPTIPKLSDYSGVLIYDETHSLMSPFDIKADYTVGSLRKWAGFLTGGYVKGLKHHPKYAESPRDYIRLRKQAMAEKRQYLEGEREDKAFLSCFKRAEQILDDCGAGIFFADIEDIEKARALDIGFIKRRRYENASFLYRELSDITMFRSIGSKEIPMFVPIIVDNRDKLRQYLTQNEVYCPVHWPRSELCEPCGQTSFIYNNELSLVCDQRYNKEDMARIRDLVRSFLRRNELA